MKVRIGNVSNSSSTCFVFPEYGPDRYSLKEIVVILKKMLDFYNDMEGTKLSFDQVFKKPKKSTQKDIDFLDIYEIHPAKIKGKTLIYSAKDNSIPWLLHDLIKDKFDAERIHLG